MARAGLAVACALFAWSAGCAESASTELSADAVRAIAERLSAVHGPALTFAGAELSFGVRQALMTGGYQVADSSADGRHVTFLGHEGGTERLTVRTRVEMPDSATVVLWSLSCNEEGCAVLDSAGAR